MTTNPEPYILQTYKTRRSAAGRVESENTWLQANDMAAGQSGSNGYTINTELVERTEDGRTVYDVQFVYTPLPVAPFIVRSDIDPLYSTPHATLVDAMTEVHSMLGYHPMALVTVTDPAGNVVYNVEIHDSCTLHREVGGFSKEGPCPKCSPATALGNRLAQEGVDRCPCGAKYWEDDRCVSCGAAFNPLDRDCEGCGAEAGAECNPGCTGRAAAEEDAWELLPPLSAEDQADALDGDVDALQERTLDVLNALLERTSDLTREEREALLVAVQVLA